MSAKNELAKLASAIGSLGLGGVGLAAIFGGLGLAPLAAGGVALGAGFLSGAAALNWGTRDEIGLIGDQKLELATELENVKDRAKILELQLRDELSAMTADRDKFKTELDRTVGELMARCMELQVGIKYWEDGLHPGILDSPQVQTLLTTLRNKLEENTNKLDKALAELDNQRKVNAALSTTIDELETANDELDTKLCNTMLELDKLKGNFDLRVQVEIGRRIEPSLRAATMKAVESKLAEIEKLKKAIGILQEELGSKETLMQLLERETLPEIENSYNEELNARDQKFLQLAGENAQLKAQIAKFEQPRRFPGITYADQAGNQVIDHFFSYGVTFDAHSTDISPDGYVIKFKVDRNHNQTKLSGEEFNKIVNQRGLFGLSRKELSFKLDQQEFMVSVELSPGFGVSPGLGSDLDRTCESGNLSTVNGNFSRNLTIPRSAKAPKVKASSGDKSDPSPIDKHRQRFIDLGCYTADRFQEIVATKFVNRVRVCSGSTGGKSPLLEMIAIELARLNNGILTLLNPIPGSPKDWFKIPGILQPGMNAEEVIADTLREFHAEFKWRRNNMDAAAKKDYMLLALDEDNSTARDYEEIGKFFKDMYQLSDHVNMGFCSAGQGLNVSGLSGGTTRKKTEEGEKNTGNATKLMKEDFLNCTMVLTAEQAKAWISTNKGTSKSEMMEQLRQLNTLCDELNELESLAARPKVGEAKKVSPNAYRIALVVSPGHDPFFMQIPAYSSSSLDGVRFPAGAKVTSPHWQELQEVENNAVLDAFVACPHCEGSNVKRLKPYADGNARYQCASQNCRKTFKVIE